MSYNISRDSEIKLISLLMQGASIRSASVIIGVDKNTAKKANDRLLAGKSDHLITEATEIAIAAIAKDGNCKRHPKAPPQPIHPMYIDRNDQRVILHLRNNVNANKNDELEDFFRETFCSLGEDLVVKGKPTLENKVKFVPPNKANNEIAATAKPATVKAKRGGKKVTRA